MTDKIPEIPVIRVSFSRQFDNNAQLIFETYAPQDIAQPDFDLLLGKLNEAGDRILMRADLEREKKLLYNDGVELERMAEGLEKVDKLVKAKASEHDKDTRRRGEFVIPESEKKAREGLVANIELLQARSRQRQERIASLEEALFFRQAAE